MKAAFDISIMNGLLKNTGQPEPKIWKELKPNDPLYNTCPWEEMAAQALTPYQMRIRESFTQAYNFIMGNLQPRTDADWERIACSLTPYTDPLTVGLVMACMNEIEREYMTAKGLEI